MKGVTDHPLLVPTSTGPVGAIVSEPDGEPRAAAILFQGSGPPARCGINALWTRIARELATLGVVVLRFDFCCEAESTLVGERAPRGPAWRSGIDLPVTRELCGWFIERTGLRTVAAGSCYGARLALESGAADPRIEALFLAAPYLGGVRRGPGTVGKRGEPRVAVTVRPDQAETGNDRLGAVAVDAAKAILADGRRLCFLLGEKDAPHALRLRDRLRERGDPLPEVEVVPDLALHPEVDPEVQAAIAGGIRTRVEEELRGS
jgi:dienelactone hydrolase